MGIHRNVTASLSGSDGTPLAKDLPIPTGQGRIVQGCRDAAGGMIISKMSDKELSDWFEKHELDYWKDLCKTGNLIKIYSYPDAYGSPGVVPEDQARNNSNAVADATEASSWAAEGFPANKPYSGVKGLKVKPSGNPEIDVPSAKDGFVFGGTEATDWKDEAKKDEMEIDNVRFKGGKPGKVILEGKNPKRKLLEKKIQKKVVPEEVPDEIVKIKEVVEYLVADEGFTNVFVDDIPYEIPAQLKADGTNYFPALDFSDVFLKDALDVCAKLSGANYTIDGAGNVSVIVTGADLTGTPLTIAVAVEAGDDKSAVAEKIRSTLDDTAAITNDYVVGGIDEKVSLTNKNDASVSSLKNTPFCISGRAFKVDQTKVIEAIPAYMGATVVAGVIGDEYVDLLKNIDEVSY